MKQKMKGIIKTAGKASLIIAGGFVLYQLHSIKSLLGERRSDEKQMIEMLFEIENYLDQLSLE